MLIEVFLSIPKVSSLFLLILASLFLCLFSLQVIGGELADRLIPVPHSSAPTDQAVREYFLRGAFSEGAGHRALHKRRTLTAPQAYALHSRNRAATSNPLMKEQQQQRKAITPVVEEADANQKTNKET